MMFFMIRMSKQSRQDPGRKASFISKVSKLLQSFPIKIQTKDSALVSARLRFEIVLSFF